MAVRTRGNGIMLDNCLKHPLQIYAGSFLHDLRYLSFVHAARQQGRRNETPVTVAAQHGFEVGIHIGAYRHVVDADRIHQALNRIDVVGKRRFVRCLKATIR